jgi:hypothetical protein
MDDVYRTIVHDVATGKVIVVQMTSHQFICQKLGLDIFTPEEEAEQKYAEFLARNAEREQAQLQQEQAKIEAQQRLATFDPAQMAEEIAAAPDTETLTNILLKMNNLLSDVKSLLSS